MLLGAALLGMARLLLGPTILDRALAVDVLLASAITGIGRTQHSTATPLLPTMLVLAVLGFVSSVSLPVRGTAAAGIDSRRVDQ